MIVPELIEVKVIDNFTIDEIHIHKNYSIKESEVKQVQALLQDADLRAETDLRRCKTNVSKSDAKDFINHLKQCGFSLIQIKQL